MTKINTPNNNTSPEDFDDKAWNKVPTPKYKPKDTNSDTDIDTTIDDEEKSVQISNRLSVYQRRQLPQTNNKSALN